MDRMQFILFFNSAQNELKELNIFRVITYLHSQESSGFIQPIDAYGAI